jgi:hypothetical protein
MHKREPEDWAAVAPIVPGQRVFNPDQMRLLLGGISRSAYYEARDAGLLKFSRTDRGRVPVHTLEQYEEYINYLNTEGEVNGNTTGRKRNRVRRRRNGDTEIEEH